MPETYQIILEGSGGQGLGMGGKILAEAAVWGGLNASQSQSYGAQARGGFSSAQVIISGQEIIYPLVDRPDIVLALTPVSYNRYKNTGNPDFLLLYDSGSENRGCKQCPGLQGPPFSGDHGFPFTEQAKGAGNPKGITLIALGTLIGLTGLVAAKHIEEAIMDNFAPSVAEANVECFRQGLNLAREALKPRC